MVWVIAGIVKTTSALRPRRFRRRLRIEVLEDRCVPSTITPTTFADGGLGSGSLRDAVLQFNADSGADDDILQLQAGTYALTIQNIGERHETAGLTGDLNIANPGHRWIIRGVGSSGDNPTIIDAGQLQDRAFQIVTPGTQVVFQDLVIQGGLAQDDGSDGALAGSTDALGGGILNNGGDVTLDEIVVQNSEAYGYQGSGFGGGINNSGTLTVSNSTLSSNSAGLFGGGIDNLGTLTVSDSTLSGNSAKDGGGILNSSTLTVSNSTLSGNSAALNGGGIDNNSTHPVTLTNVTLTANRANTGSGSGRGGGLFVGFESATLVPHNTLIAANFRGATGATSDDVNGRLDLSGDYNLIGDGTGMTGLSNGVNGNLVGSAAAPIDPLLGPLDDNGGPTETMALLPGSPALNAGDPTQLSVADQRGVVRIGGVNIGAYQASAGAFVLAVPPKVTAGVPFDVTVTAVDRFGQLAAGYTGTVTFATTDPNPGVVLPADYSFTADDSGVHTFTDTGLGETTLRTRGHQTITATDTADGSIQGSVTVKVRRAGHASPLLGVVANGPGTPDTAPTQAPTWQATQGPSESQPARSEAAPGPVPLAMARHAQDAVFEAWDMVTDGLALS